MSVSLWGYSPRPVAMVFANSGIIFMTAPKSRPCTIRRAPFFCSAAMSSAVPDGRPQAMPAGFVLRSGCRGKPMPRTTPAGL